MALAAGRSIQTAGWVHSEYCCAASEAPPCSGECHDAVFREISVSTRYIAALYKVLNALENANTSSEQGFAVFAEIATGIIFGALAGAMSTLMMSMNADSAEIADNLRTHRHHLLLLRPLSTAQIT